MSFQLLPNQGFSEASEIPCEVGMGSSLSGSPQELFCSSEEEKCPGAWWECLEIPGAVLCGAEKSVHRSFPFFPPLKEFNIPLV